MSGGRGTGLLSKAWQALRGLVSKETLVGTDAGGNRYYKWLEKDHAGVLLERRRVKVAGNDMLYDPKIIPPEWRAWLARTRADPPSEQEMAKAAERGVLMRQRVAAIEEREAQRRIRQEAAGRQGAAAAGPDMGAFVSQLENRGYGSGGQQQQQAGSSSSSSSTPHTDGGKR